MLQLFYILHMHVKGSNDSNPHYPKTNERKMSHIHVKKKHKEFPHTPNPTQ